MGLSLDIMQSFPQLPEIAEFARAVPEVTIILNHVGGVSRTGIYAGKDDEVIPAWREGIAAVAQNPNVVCKLGGLGMPRWGFGWCDRDIPIGSEELAEAMAPWMNYCIEQFGPDRCMFESNFPPDKVSFSYNVMYNAFKRMSSGSTAHRNAPTCCTTPPSAPTASTHRRTPVVIASATRQSRESSAHRHSNRARRVAAPLAMTKSVRASGSIWPPPASLARW